MGSHGERGAFCGRANSRVYPTHFNVFPDSVDHASDGNGPNEEHFYQWPPADPTGLYPPASSGFIKNRQATKTVSGNPHYERAHHSPLLQEYEHGSGHWTSIKNWVPQFQCEPSQYTSLEITNPILGSDDSIPMMQFTSSSSSYDIPFERNPLGAMRHDLLNQAEASDLACGPELDYEGPFDEFDFSMLPSPLSPHAMIPGITSPLEVKTDHRQALERFETHRSSPIQDGVPEEELIVDDNHPTMLTCTSCGEVSKSQYDWRRHEANHHKPWICQPAGTHVIDAHCGICGIRDTSDRHKMTHHGLRECAAKAVDKRSFRGRDKLTDHLKKHLGLPVGAKLPEDLTSVRKELLRAWEAPPQLDMSALWCGFCPCYLTSWTERQDHVLKHLLDDKSTGKWKSPSTSIISWNPQDQP